MAQTNTELREQSHKYLLNVREGVYRADNLFALIWSVISHRFWHWQRGDGWVD